MDTGIAEGATASLTERVAEEIRVVMTRRRIRQSELARALGKSEQWVSVRLRGVQAIDLNDLQMIAEILSVDAHDLLPRADEGRVLTTAGQDRGERKPGTTIRKFGLTERPRPDGHPKRTVPDASTRRPGRLMHA